MRRPLRLRHLLLAASLLAGAAQAPAEAKDDLVIGAAQFPSTLNPFIDPEVIKLYALAFAQRQVSAFDKDWHPVCLMCETLPSLENGLAVIEDRPDGTKGMKVTIKLKPGLQWGDGKPVTAQDLAFTWKLAADPNAGFSNQYPWGRASKVEVVDDRTAVLHTAKVIVDYMMWDQVLPEHLEGPVVAAATAPGDYIKSTLYAREPTNPGLWNGPYMITQYQSGAQVVFEPNPHWPGPKPGLRRIVLRTIENTAALQANLLSGDVDLVAGEGVGLTIDQALALRKQAPDRFMYEFRPSLTYEHIDLNLDNPLLADVRTRRALLLATDRQTLVTRLFEGLQPVAATWVNPLHPMYDPTVKPAPYDLPGAKKLLADAGWTPGRGRHLPQRPGPAPIPGVRHHRRQPPARADAAGAAERLEGRLRRGDDQERAGPHPVRPDPEAAEIHRHGPVRLEQLPQREPAPHPGHQRHPCRRQQLRRCQLPRLQQP